MSPSQWERATVQVSPGLRDLEAEDLESKGAFMEGHRGQHTPPTESSELRLQGGGSPSVTYTPVSGAAGTPLAAPVWRPIAAPQLVSPLGSGSALPLAFPTAGYVGRRLHGHSAVPRGAGSGRAGRSPCPVLPAWQAEGLWQGLHRLPGHLQPRGGSPPSRGGPGEAVPGPVCGVRRYQAALLLNFSRGKADLIWTGLPPRWRLPSQLLVVLWTPRPEGGLGPQLAAPLCRSHPSARDRELPPDLMEGPSKAHGSR